MFVISPEENVTCTQLSASLVVDLAFLDVVEFGRVVVDVLILEEKKDNQTTEFGAAKTLSILW